MGSADYYGLEDLVGFWIKEKRLFKSGLFPKVSYTGRWEDVAHYTQMIWKGTTNVGCALHVEGGRNYLICRYSPPGNADGRPSSRRSERTPPPRRPEPGSSSVMILTGSRSRLAEPPLATNRAPNPDPGRKSRNRRPRRRQSPPACAVHQRQIARGRSPAPCRRFDRRFGQFSRVRRSRGPDILVLERIGAGTFRRRVPRKCPKCPAPPRPLDPTPGQTDGEARRAKHLRSHRTARSRYAQPSLGAMR